MARLPSLFALRALEAAVRRRSYSAAARELAVTQGAISQQIRKLEAELGARLFTRHGNEMVPSPEARRLALETAAAVGRLHTAIEAFEPLGEREPLVLSLTASTAQRWLAPRLPRLLAAPQGAGLEVRVEDRVANFTTDGIDLGVRVGRGDWPDLVTRRMTVERFCVVCTPQFAARHRIRGPEDLLAAPLVHDHERNWALFFDRHGLPTPAPAGVVSNSALVMGDAVLRGLGAGLQLVSLVVEDLREGRLMRPVPDIVPLPLNFIRPGQLVRPFREGDPMPPEIGYFVVWRAESRKLGRIRALADWLIADAKASEAAAGLG